MADDGGGESISIGRCIPLASVGIGRLIIAVDEQEREEGRGGDERVVWCGCGVRKKKKRKTIGAQVDG